WIALCRLRVHGVVAEEVVALGVELRELRERPLRLRDLHQVVDAARVVRDLDVRRVATELHVAEGDDVLVEAHGPAVHDVFTARSGLEPFGDGVLRLEEDGEVTAIAVVAAAAGAQGGWERREEGPAREEHRGEGSRAHGSKGSRGGGSQGGKS